MIFLRNLYWSWFCYKFSDLCISYIINSVRLSTTFDEVSVYPIPAALYLVKNLLQVGLLFFDLSIHSSSFGHRISDICYIWQYYIFAYVDAPGYQILKNLNIISTGVLYRIILKRK